MIDDRLDDAEDRSRRRPALAPRVVGHIKSADAKVVDLVKKRPIGTLTSALLFGYILGRWFGGRR
jgi:hypothetical protein